MSIAENRQAILEGRTALGIELGSTRIKAVLINEQNEPIAFLWTLKRSMVQRQSLPEQVL